MTTVERERNDLRFHQLLKAHLEVATWKSLTWALTDVLLALLQVLRHTETADIFPLDDETKSEYVALVRLAETRIARAREELGE